MNELLKKSASEQRKALLNKEISAVELVNATYERIDEVEDKVKAFNSLTKDTALETAKKVDEKIAKGEELPLLAGIPLVLKDNMNLVGSKTTASSKILENFVSPYNATITDKLLNNLVPIIAKANLDEFAMGSSNENSAFGKVHNPWNLNKVPGGSSGGSAASVAACEATLSLGSDTGGSIRLPASFCGIVGMKPTYGRVSRYGLIAFASSLDQIGPFARTVEDAATLLQVISGHDAKDSTSLDIPVEDYSKSLNNDIKGRKIGVIKELMGEGLSDDVRKAIDLAIDTYKQQGAEIVELSLPSLKYSIGIYYILATAECSSNLARFDGVKYGYRAKEFEGLHDMYKKTRSQGFGPEVKRRIMLGSFVLSSGYYDAYYLKALRTKALIKKAFDNAFSKYDVILAPAAPTTAPKLGESLTDPLKMYLGDIYTISVNLAGLPGISVPCGEDSKGLPIGVQMIGDCFKEKNIIRAAYSFEQAKED